MYHEDFLSNPDIPKEKITIPENWNNKTVGNQNLSPIGYTTYRSIILFDTIGQKLVIKLSSMSSASRLYVNGDLLFEAGHVDTNKTESVPE